MHNSKQQLGVVAAIDTQVRSFRVLDLAQEKDLLYVYASKVASNGQNQLEMIQIHYSEDEMRWMQPAQVSYELPIE